MSRYAIALHDHHTTDNGIGGIAGTEVQPVGTLRVRHAEARRASPGPTRIVEYVHAVLLPSRRQRVRRLVLARRNRCHGGVGAREIALVEQRASLPDFRQTDDRRG